MYLLVDAQLKLQELLARTLLRPMAKLRDFRYPGERVRSQRTRKPQRGLLWHWPAPSQPLGKFARRLGPRKHLGP